MRLNTFESHVEDRLDVWGEAFAFHRNIASLGGPQSAIQAMMAHTGATGSRPLSVDPAVMQIEDLVRKVHEDSRIVACVLRAYHCGSGTKGWDRYEKAKELAKIDFSRRSYYTYYSLGFDMVTSMLSACAIASKRPIAQTASVW